MKTLTLALAGHHLRAYWTPPKPHTGLFRLRVNLDCLTLINRQFLSIESMRLATRYAGAWCRHWWRTHSPLPQFYLERVDRGGSTPVTSGTRHWFRNGREAEQIITASFYREGRVTWRKITYVQYRDFVDWHHE